MEVLSETPEQQRRRIIKERREQRKADQEAKRKALREVRKERIAARLARREAMQLRLHERQEALLARREAILRGQREIQAANQARREAAMRLRRENIGAIQRRRQERLEEIRKQREETARKKREEEERLLREEEERKRLEEERMRLEEEERRKRQDTLVVSIGINYTGQSGELMGCVNDSYNLVNSVYMNIGDRIGKVVQMTDNLPQASSDYPTRANIEKAITNAVQDVEDGKFKKIIFHYSGHGGQVSDTSGDELDKLDETLVPVDYALAGMIPDDWLYDNVINKLPLGVQFLGLIDACHSGSVIDLRHRVTGVDGDNLTYELAHENASGTADAMMISGCKDSELSADVWDAKYGPCGAMTSAFLDEIGQERTTPVVDIVDRMRVSLQAKGYPQIPQLSVSKQILRNQPMYVMGE
jgi:hypothetical protein